MVNCQKQFVIAWYVAGWHGTLISCWVSPPIINYSRTKLMSNWFLRARRTPSTPLPSFTFGLLLMLLLDLWLMCRHLIGTHTLSRLSAGWWIDPKVPWHKWINSYRSGIFTHTLIDSGEEEDEVVGLTDWLTRSSSTRNRLEYIHLMEKKSGTVPENRLFD